jgi:poly-beta-1,6-N-acetyl-D-glucosamine synthase
MLLLKILFFLGIFIIFYSYIGYGLLLWLIDKFSTKVLRRKQPSYNMDDLPAVTLVVAAYNEEKFIEEKIQNTLSLDYPKNKFHFIVITDGSSDRTAEKASAFSGVQVLHHPDRKGKIAAIHRAMEFVKTPVVIFSDANTLLNSDSIKNIARHYQFGDIGGVAGEKKILNTGGTAVEGEGVYWKYESFLKKMDARLYSVVGAAGELFSIRTSLYEYVGDNVLLDDFVISLRVCKKGYRVAYEPDAFAMETPSASMKEEQKRKIRISAGAFQSMRMFLDLLNPFKYPMLSFQYISHRVLRWTLCPLFLPLIYIINWIIVLNRSSSNIYTAILVCQTVFYLLALAGWICSRLNIKVKLLYVPYYFVFINLSLYLGFLRYLKGNQTVLWEKARRENYVVNP